MADKKTNKHRCPAILYVQRGNDVFKIQCELLKGHLVDKKHNHFAENLKWRID